jgi:hypothetical protein
MLPAAGSQAMGLREQPTGSRPGKQNDPFFGGYLLQIGPPRMKVNEFAAAE